MNLRAKFLYVLKFEKRILEEWMTLVKLIKISLQPRDAEISCARQRVTSTY